MHVADDERHVMTYDERHVLRQPLSALFIINHSSAKLYLLLAGASAGGLCCVVTNKTYQHFSL
jgi:hypothetical protein